MKNMLLAKCCFSLNAKTFAAREAGCPLDHCECGTHDAMNDYHKCKKPQHMTQEELDWAECDAMMGDATP